MPSAKRARQRAGRDARRAALAKQQQRRKTVRRAITIAIVAVVVVGSVYLITRPKSSTPTAQAVADAAAVKAGCPTSTTARVNTLQFKKPAQVISPSKTYTATVDTTLGSFDIALDAKSAPIAVNSFVFLAQKNFFHCVIFHRVIKGEIDQTGDPTGRGTGGPGYQFTEAGPAVATPQYPEGSVAMANADSPATTTPKTNGSQFFITVGKQYEALPPDYVLFGHVSSGMSVVKAINKDGSATGVPPKVTQRILSVTIHES